jgi:hypothetical protein
VTTTQVRTDGVFAGCVQREARAERAVESWGGEGGEAKESAGGWQGEPSDERTKERICINRLIVNNTNTILKF